MARIFLDIREKIDAELWLIGDGPERAKVESIFEDKGVGADIRSWGLQLDVAPILAQTDLLLMTSLTENFSLATLEAMACGIPVLTTDVGGQSEVVVHGKTGFLFPLGDHGSAVALAVELLTDPIRYLAFSQSATAHASQFASRKVVPSYERLYRRMLENRSRGTDRQLMPAY